MTNAEEKARQRIEEAARKAEVNAAGGDLRKERETVVNEEITIALNTLREQFADALGKIAASTNDRISDLSARVSTLEDGLTRTASEVQS